MTNPSPDYERRKQARLEKLGTNDPKCGVCGLDNWLCIELHHVAGQKHDETVVLLCANHHRTVTDDQKNHPSSSPAGDPFLDTVGRFLLGLADMLKTVVEKLYEFGKALIERAKSQPNTQAV